MEWMGIIKEHRKSGLAIRKWCEMNQVSAPTSLLEQCNPSGFTGEGLQHGGDGATLLHEDHLRKKADSRFSIKVVSIKISDLTVMKLRFSAVLIFLRFNLLLVILH